MRFSSSCGKNVLEKKKTLWNFQRNEFNKRKKEINLKFSLFFPLWIKPMKGYNPKEWGESFSCNKNEILLPLHWSFMLKQAF